MTHIHYYWWIKYWRFYDKIANRQSLLLANISSYTVYCLHFEDINKYYSSLHTLQSVLQKF